MPSQGVLIPEVPVLTRGRLQKQPEPAVRSTDHDYPRIVVGIEDGVLAQVLALEPHAVWRPNETTQGGLVSDGIGRVVVVAQTKSISSLVVGLELPCLSAEVPWELLGRAARDTDQLGSDSRPCHSVVIAANNAAEAAGASWRDGVNLAGAKEGREGDR